ncbi:MAG: nuclear transport factor 2 family protein [Caulobacterales bacterium]|nr:nuclear transport factor 2 family protein [Caulobacterales bacterium]
MLELARHLIDRVEAGDVEGYRRCFHPDAGVWHNYDGVTQTLDQNTAVFENILAKTRSRTYEFKRLEEISGGYLQQHTLRVVTHDGAELAAEAIAVVLVDGGKIRRIEEYLDPTPLAALRG